MMSPHSLRQAVAGFLLFLQRPPLDDRLRGDAGVVRAGQPQGFAALHAAPANKNVLEGVIQRVAQVQPVRDVRRRNDDREGFAGGVGCGVKMAALLPHIVNAALDGRRVVDLGEFLPRPGFFVSHWLSLRLS
jgi:hypothetical protein